MYLKVYTLILVSKFVLRNQTGDYIIQSQWYLTV